MGWISLIFIGAALGWFLELLLDIWFWGRRHRHLEAELSQSQAHLQSSKKELIQAQALLAQYKAQEDDYHKCQIDRTVLTEKNNSLETATEKITLELKQSEKFIDQLHAEHAQLNKKRDHLHSPLEAVDQGDEASIRRRVWDTGIWGRKFSRPKDQVADRIRTITETAASNISRATVKIESKVISAKKKFQRTWPNRWLNRGYCALWALIRKVSKKSMRPQSCTLNSK